VPKNLRVYGWTAYSIAGVEKVQFNHSFRCIVAATSKDEVARVANVSRPSRLGNLYVTTNPVEVATAMSKPGVVFYRFDHLHGDITFQEVPDPTSRL
jgi:hypothetical protein